MARIASVICPVEAAPWLIDFAPRFVPASEEIVPADTVLLAIGQAIDPRTFARDPDIVLTPRGTVQTDPDSLATSVAGVFAGGDAAFGARNIISAIAEGRRAALSIERFVGRGSAAQRSYAMRTVPLLRDHDPFELTPRVALPVIPIERRVGFREVEEVYTLDEARREADRCFWCHVHPVFDSDRCVLCGGCADVCPVSCLRLVPLGSLELPAETQLALAAGMAPEEVPSVESMTAILMESELCIRCGLCALRCPTDAIEMQEIQCNDKTG